MRIFLISGLFAAFLAVPVRSLSLPAPPSSSAAKPHVTLPAVTVTVTVTGDAPGPGLWKVSQGHHVMWVLGTLAPLPKRMMWRSDEVEHILAGAQELLQAPTVKLKVDAGFFGKLALLPLAYFARKNPDGATLQQVLPPAIYAHWKALKPVYFGNDRRIESWRPILVAWKLYQKALKRSGLTSRNDINEIVYKLADKHNVRRVPVKYELVLNQPREALAALRKHNLHDVSCFNQTLKTVQDDMGRLAERASAWSTGNMQALRGLAADDRYRSCLTALTDADFAAQLDLRDVPKRMELAWLRAAQTALARHSQTVAVLPMEEVLSPDGYLAHLQALGYLVQAP